MVRVNQQHVVHNAQHTTNENKARLHRACLLGKIGTLSESFGQLSMFKSSRWLAQSYVSLDLKHEETNSDQTSFLVAILQTMSLVTKKTFGHCLLREQFESQ